MQSGTRIQGVIFHTTPILTRPMYHIRQHTTRISDLHLLQTLVITTIQSMAVLPNNLHQYWGYQGYLATTRIEPIMNILHFEIQRNMNDGDVLKNPLELNSPEEIKSDRRHQERTPSHRHHINSKIPT